jgi:hypothetical protein
VAYELNHVMPDRTPKPGGVHHVRCVEAKKLDQTGGDGDPKRGILQG